jgi:hypothetical protein
MNKYRETVQIDGRWVGETQVWVGETQVFFMPKKTRDYLFNMHTFACCEEKHTIVRDETLKARYHFGAFGFTDLRYCL